MSQMEHRARYILSLLELVLSCGVLGLSRGKVLNQVLENELELAGMGHGREEKGIPNSSS